MPVASRAAERSIGTAADHQVIVLGLSSIIVITSARALSDWCVHCALPAAMLVASGLLGTTCIPAAALGADGQVLAGGGAVAGSTVTVWAASVGEPRLAQARSALQQLRRQQPAIGRCCVRTPHRSPYELATRNASMGSHDSHGDFGSTHVRASRSRKLWQLRECDVS